ncbi:MAG: hypothetical protein EAZ53_08280 [Bacteroidetes bacterium]|nr:MAG: hypothetical protein EAZ53_08280 [Bacteroidota bacterium]
MLQTNTIVMARIAGIKEHRSDSGKLKSITINIEKWGSHLEDFLDMIEVESVRKKNDFIGWDEFKTKSLKLKLKLK